MSREDRTDECVERRAYTPVEVDLVVERAQKPTDSALLAEVRQPEDCLFDLVRIECWVRAAIGDATDVLVERPLRERVIHESAIHTRARRDDGECRRRDQVRCSSLDECEMPLARTHGPGPQCAVAH